MRALIRAVFVGFLLVSPTLVDADFPRPLQEAATREELAKHFGTRIGFGQVEKWEFTTAGRDLIIFSYCPYSGRAACYVHAYYHDRAKHIWILFIDRLLEPAITLSAEISAADQSLVFKDRDGRTVEKKSLAELPQ